MRRWLTLSGMGRRLLPTLTVVGLTVIWELYVVLMDVPEYLLPAPSGVLMVLLNEMGYLMSHLGITTLETLLGLAASIVIGVGLGVLMVVLPALEAALYPLLVASQCIPKIAIAPLLVVWAGIGLFPKVLVAFLIAFFPMVIATVSGLRSVEPELLYLARSMGASEMRMLFKIKFPTALPHMFSGLKVAVSLVVVGALVGEFIQADRGLGYVLLLANGNFDMDLAFAALMLLVMLGVVMFFTVVALERWLIPWHASQRAGPVIGTL